MKYLLLLVINTYMTHAPSVTVIEFDTMSACLEEKKDIHLYLKMQSIGDDSLHMECLRKAEAPVPNGR